MKIHKIILKDYQQFKDLTIDLTYPTGHEKAGQPLDKVCFIGQSGTGKTTLLRLVKWFVTWNPFVTPDIRVDNIPGATVHIEATHEGNRGSRSIQYPDIDASLGWAEITDQHLRNSRPTLINLPTEHGLMPRKDMEDILSMTFFYPNGVFDARSHLLQDYFRRLDSGCYLDLTYQKFDDVTSNVLDAVKQYQISELLETEKVAAVALNSKSKMAEIEESRLRFEEWSRTNPDPIDKVYGSTAPILETIGVRVKTKIDQEVLKNLGTIQIQTLSGVDVPYANWSTGTKQVVETAVPLVHLNPNDAIILIDEPEKSLYPDIQSKIIDFYTSLTTDCQFFYATHSPIIASSFDPWEIVELKFDPTNQFVELETNHVGERHVDNYTVYPKYLKWDAILTKLFGMLDDGNSEYRMEAVTKAAALELELEAIRDQGKNSGPKFERMLAEYIKLKTKLGWE